jgi:hypothetical protein
LQKVGLFDPDGKKWGRIGYIIFASLLYDDVKGFLRVLVPSAKWMKKKYGIENPWFLPLFYLRRLADLALRRNLVK